MTDTNPEYEGSVTVASDLLSAADIAPLERVQVVNVTTGARLETYAIEGPPKVIELNGVAAHRGSPGDIVILLTYAKAGVADQPTPKIAHASDANGVDRTEQKHL